MTQAQTINRASLNWLMAAQFLVIAPHLLHLPVWIGLFGLGCVFWRLQIFRMQVAYPSPLAKVALVLAAGLGVFLSRGSLVGLDAGMVLLVAAFILKLVEMRSPRDARVLATLGFFVVLTGYLFEDGMLYALYSVLPIAALLAALIGLEQNPLQPAPKKALRLAGVMLLQALPLMLVLFVLFPRIGPLWSLPLPSETSYSGLSSSMSPGDIAKLGLNPDLAFRARFNDTVPASEQLYWRALTLDHFDGRRWSMSPSLGHVPRWQAQGSALDYSIVMQPTGQRWLFALDVAETDLPNSRLMDDFRLQRRARTTQLLLYNVRSWPQASRQADAELAFAQRFLQLPEQGDPRTRAWAAKLTQQYPEASALVAAMLQHFAQQPYTYTLRPPLLGENSIDGFLFDTQRGFCAHYAGAMTYVLRAAGIPARVVAGYQGGEINPDNNSVQVRQYDAHAWVEYWQPQRGWSRVDPTFAVAPERIERGLEAALAKEQSFLENSPFSALRYQKYGWFNRLRLSWDTLNDAWQRQVLGFQSTQQQGLWQRWFAHSSLQPGVWLILLITTSMGLIAVWMLKPWQGEADPARRLLRGFEKTLAKHGLVRASSEPLTAFVARAAERLPAQRAQLIAFSEGYEAYLYGEQSHLLASLQQQLKQLRRALPWPRLKP